MGFRLLPKSVTLNDLKRHNGRYILCYSSEFGSFGTNYVKVVEVRFILLATEM